MRSNRQRTIIFELLSGAASVPKEQFLLTDPNEEFFDQALQSRSVWRDVAIMRQYFNHSSEGFQKQMKVSTRILVDNIDPSVRLGKLQEIIEQSHLKKLQLDLKNGFQCFLNFD